MLWIKAFHIIAITCWFAGIFYLPRLFVYHAMAKDQATRDQLKIMQRKLFNFMSMLAVLGIGFGLWLLSGNWDYYWQANWFIIKVILVAALIAYHLSCGYFVTQFERGMVQHSHTYFRWFNELPVLILVAVVILVVVKPF